MTTRKSPSRTAAEAAKTSSPERPRSAARARILKAAERLFAEHGFEGCSLRDVAALAQVNQGMIHYFFKSKETLFVETYLSCGRTLVGERMDLLRAEEAASAGAPIRVERLIEIFLTPAVKLALSGPSGRSFLRLQSRLQLTGTRFGAQLRSQLYDESSRRFVQAFEKALPGLTRQQVSWRFIFMLGTYQYVLSNTGRLETLSGGTCDGRDFAEALRQMVPFLAAGMREGTQPDEITTSNAGRMKAQR